MGTFISEIASLVLFFVVIAAAWKQFQIATDLHDIKDLLQDIKRNSQDYSAPRRPVDPSAAVTPEELVRRVHAESFDEDSPLLAPIPSRDRHGADR